MSELIREQLIRGLRDLAAQEPDPRTEAILLDRDNQLVSTGTAILDIEKSSAEFWPHSPTGEEKPLQTASKLKMSDGQIHEIANLREFGELHSVGMAVHLEMDLI